jgi:hypothetical protein
MWQDYFNRAIGQLAGFQSMMSILLNNTDDFEDLGVPATTPLGNLHFPDTMTVAPAAGAAGTLTFTWSAELGLNGTVDDLFRHIAISVAPVNTDERLTDYSDGATDRADSPLEDAIGPASTDFIVGVFFKGLGTAEGLLSPCKWYAATTHA